jgi:hypothetical protein
MLIGRVPPILGATLLPSCGRGARARDGGGHWWDRHRAMLFLSAHRIFPLGRVAAAGLFVTLIVMMLSN